MEVKIKNTYTVYVEKCEQRTFENIFDDVIYDYVEWLDEDTLPSEDALKEDFAEYIRDNCAIVPNFLGTDEELDEYSLELTILNWDEVFPKLSHLIVTPKPETCCDKAPCGANYCPTCGNKLIKK